MDAYAGVTVGRVQHSFRCSRRLGDRPLDTRIGPLRLEVDLANGTHRFELADNDSGIACDLAFEPSFPTTREKQSCRTRGDTIEEDLARLCQTGRWRGWISLQGTRHTVEPGNWWGQRDRSWGIRSEMRTDVDKPPVQQHAGFLWTWTMLQFERSAVTLFLKEREPGRPYYLSCIEQRRDSDGSVRSRLGVAVEHDIAWADDPLGQTVTHATLRISFDDGDQRVLRIETLVPRFYLKAGLYGGLGGWNHGDDRGDYAESYSVWDLDDPSTRDRARTLSDHVVRATSGDETGFGISEYGVARGYPRYTKAQRFPAL